MGCRMPRLRWLWHVREPHRRLVEITGMMHIGGAGGGVACGTIVEEVTAPSASVAGEYGREPAPCVRQIVLLLKPRGGLAAVLEEDGSAPSMSKHSA